MGLGAAAVPSWRTPGESELARDCIFRAPCVILYRENGTIVSSPKENIQY